MLVALSVSRSVPVLTTFGLGTKSASATAFLASPGLRRFSEVVLSNGQRLVPQFEHDSRQRDIGEVTPARASLAQLVKFGVEFCARFLGEVLQFSQ